MAHPGHHSSSLSSLSSLSPRSPRSSSLIARSQLDPDHLDQQAPAEYRDAPGHLQDHPSAAGQHEQARASESVSRAHLPSDDDVRLGEVEGADASRAPSTEHQDDYERYEGQGAGAYEVEVEVAASEVRVDEALSQADFENMMAMRSQEDPLRPACNNSSSPVYIQQGSYDAHEGPSMPAMTWQPSGRFGTYYTSPRRSDRSYTPPLTPRSSNALSTFDLDRFASRRRAPPPPSHAAYRYTLPLPLTSFGPRVIGLHGTTINRIKRDSHVCEVLVLFRVDRLANVVVTGTRAAIERALDLIDVTIAHHTNLGPVEQRFLYEHGMGWCRFDERKLEPLDGYWVHDVFAEPDLSRRRDERSHQTQAYGPAHGLDHGRARQPSPPRRRSSRSLSPARSSCRSPVGDDTSYCTRRSPSSPSLESPAEVKPAKLVDRISSRCASDDTFSSEASQSSLLAGSSQVLVDTVEEPTSAFTIPIPIAAIERFVGPNAAGHFITQTTGVALKVEAGLAGATLRLEPGAAASSASLLEARQLVDKVLVSSGLAPPPPAPPQGTSKERSTHGPRRARTPFKPALPAHAPERRSSAPRKSVVEPQGEERGGGEGGRSRSGWAGGADGRWAERREAGGTERVSGSAGRAQERGRGRSSREEQTRSPTLDRHTQDRSRSRSPAPRRRTSHAYDYDSHAGEPSSRTGPPPRSPRYKSQGYPPPADQARRDRMLPRADDYGHDVDSEHERRRREGFEHQGSAVDTWLEMRGGGRGDGAWAPSRVVGQWPGPRGSQWRR